VNVNQKEMGAQMLHPLQIHPHAVWIRMEMDLRGQHGHPRIRMDVADFGMRMSLKL
ncbi:hypothetical protein J6590_101253, partial [Homalodisca vitripennis]